MDREDRDAVAVVTKCLRLQDVHLVLQDAGESSDGRLGAAVSRCPWQIRRRGAGGCVDDGAGVALLHRGEDHACEFGGGFDHDFHLFPPVFGIGHVEGEKCVGAGIADEDIDRAKFLGGLRSSLAITSRHTLSGFGRPL